MSSGARPQRVACGAVATSNELIGRVLGGRYRLRALIGTGASAQVFLADDTTLRRQVAVKVLHAPLAADETFLRRFRKEAEAAAGLNNPNVLAVYDWGQDDLPYIVAEYLSGGSLRAMLDAGHRLSLSQTLLVGLEVARGLEYAHRRGLVHRDIKPANLLFDEDRRLRIADFGLARALAEAGVTEPAGSIIGTARYASPEQARGETLSGKTDVYSLALVLIECVTGEVPFVTDTTLGSLLARVDQPLPVPAALGSMRPAIERAGHPDPAQRPEAEEFAIGLMAAAEDLRRPEPLPIVGALGGLDRGRIDLTMMRPMSDDEAPRAGGSGPEPTAEEVSSPSAEGQSVAPGPARTAAEIDDADDARRRWPWVLLGVLLLGGAVSGGVFSYLQHRTISHTMPDLVTAEEQDLRTLAAKYKWNLAEPAKNRSDSIGAGLIIDVTPPAGAKVVEGATVQFTVSLGPKPVVIPKLEGLTLDEARAELEKRSLALGTPIRDFSETVAKDKIIARETVGNEAVPGSPVVVKVSDGPKPRTIPDGLVDQPEATAKAKLEELKLVVVRAEEFNDTIKPGNVIRLDPVPASSVARDSSVQVVVSKGPEPRAIPNVFGLSAAQAAQVLRDKGFEVGDTRGPADRSVLGTDPPAGELRLPATRVNIITRTT